MVSVSVQVMADLRRTDLVARLLTRLGLTAEHVTWDRRGGIWDTRRRATVTAAERGSDWTLVLQDDVLVCRDLIPTVERLLREIPDESIVHLAVLAGSPIAKTIRYAVEQADAHGGSWVRTRALMWGIALAVPTVTVTPMLAWSDRLNTIAGDDTRVGQFYQRRRWPTLYPWPSLIDHARVPSLLRNRDGRAAYGFIGEETSGLDLHWSGGIVDA